MPLYEFKCDACSLVFEELVFSSSSGVTCPRCKGDRVERLLSTFAHARANGGGGAASASSTSSSCTRSSCAGCSGCR
jgi:putative FmdB family regulatory protein